MNIINFIKTLLPTLDKADIVEDLRIAMDELDNIAIPSYRSAEDFFNFNKPKSKEFKELETDFYRSLDTHGIRKQSIFIKDITIRLINVRQNAEFIYNELSKVSESDIVNNEIKAHKAVLLESASNISFITSYSTDFLNYIYAIEELFKTKNAIDLPKATITYIKNNFKRFTFTLSDLGMPPREFEKVIGDIPDVSLSHTNENAIKSLFDINKVDPFSNIPITGFIGNPIYHIRLSIAEWQARRFKAAKAKKKVLELRLLHLKNMQEDNSDPKLEKEIEYNQSRLDKLNKYLQDFQDELS